ncbi:MAG: hypothetical protein WBW33_11075, partial [Bryobacteraceae bacterium]
MKPGLTKHNLRKFHANGTTRIRRPLTLALVLLTLALVLMWRPGLAVAADDFNSWWPKFQAAVAAHDVQAVA